MLLWIKWIICTHLFFNSFYNFCVLISVFKPFTSHNVIWHIYNSFSIYSLIFCSSLSLSYLLLRFFNTFSELHFNAPIRLWMFVLCCFFHSFYKIIIHIFNFPKSSFNQFYYFKWNLEIVLLNRPHYPSTFMF